MIDPTELEFHPLAGIFPLMEGAEFTALVDDIRDHGQRETIVLHEGKILDGRNRYRACQEIDAEPRTEQWIGNGTAAEFVASMNIRRRHLSTEQCSAFAAELVNTKQGERTELPPNGGSSITQKDAAKMMNVGHTTVSRAMKRMREDPEAHEAAKAGVKKYTGGVIPLPANITPEAAVRAGLEIEKSGGSAEKAAKEIGIGVQSYRTVHRIILLSDRDDLSDADRATVNAAMAQLNETRSAKAPAKMIAPIANRVWGALPNSALSKAESRRMKQFERAWTFIVDTCRTSAVVTVPYLAADKAKEISAEMKKAEAAVHTLRRRIEEYTNA